MQTHDFDAPSLDPVREPRGRSRLFLEDDPPISVEDDPPTSVEYDAPVSSVTKWGASAVIVFFLALAGVGGTLAWRYYGSQATDIGAQVLPGATNKPTAPFEGFAVLPQQFKSIATDLSALRHTLEQQSADNHDQLTRIQEQITQLKEQISQLKEQISQQSIALLSSPPAADKPVHKPLPKPAQPPAHVSTQDSSKPIQVAPPQYLLPPKQ